MKKEISVPVSFLAGLVLALILLLAALAMSLRRVKGLSCRAIRTGQDRALVQDSLLTARDSILRLNDSLYDATLFSLDNNDEALDYLSRFYTPRKDWKAYVSDKLLDYSLQYRARIIPYEGIDAPMGINNVRILNHKWLIASFTDGRQWGEMLMEYEPVGSDSIRFTLLRALLYPPVGR